MNTRKLCIVLGLLYFSIQILVSSCANVSSPTGGPKDTIPPRLVDIYPSYGTLQFNEKVIRLEFDEPIQLKDLKNQLIITPSVEADYKIKQTKTGLELTFEEKFSDSTTYTFAFREAIGDLNEGNPVEDLKLAFSTGDYLDSLSINGRIEDLMTGKPIEDALVSLYRAHDTLTLFNSRPYYLAKSNKEGYYQFDNLKTGQYLIYATKDANKNLKADSRTEPFGFIKDTLDLVENIDSLHINIQRINTEPLMVNNSRPTGQYYEITLNKGVRSYKLEPMDTTAEQLYSNLVEQSKKIRVYNTAGIEDSLAAYLTVTDSLKQQLQDTLYVKFQESRRPKEPFSLSVDPKGGSPIQEHFKATFTFTKPVTAVNFDSLFFRYDSLTYVRADTAGNFTWNSQRDKLVLTTKLDASLADKPAVALDGEEQAAEANGEAKVNQKKGPAGVELYAGKGAFISADQDSSAVQQLKYTFADSKNFGTIQGNFSTQAPGFTIQLLQAGNLSVAKEIENQQNFLFKQVQPGEYRIRILIDRDGNGQWDPGNINERIEPEPVIITEEKIVLKANWEITNILLGE